MTTQEPVRDPGLGRLRRALPPVVESRHLPEGFAVRFTDPDTGLTTLIVPPARALLHPDTAEGAASVSSS